jgi:hypothetical protein
MGLFLGFIKVIALCRTPPEELCARSIDGLRATNLVTMLGEVRIFVQLRRMSTHRHRLPALPREALFVQVQHKSGRGGRTGLSAQIRGLRKAQR